MRMISEAAVKFTFSVVSLEERCQLAKNSFNCDYKAKELNLGPTFFYDKGQKGRRSKKTWRIGPSNRNLRNVNMFSITFFFHYKCKCGFTTQRCLLLGGSGLSFDTRKYGRRGPESRVFYKPPEHREMKEPREESAAQRWSCQRTLVSQHKERLAQRSCVFTLGRDVKEKKRKVPIQISPHFHSSTFCYEATSKKMFYRRVYAML